MELTRAGVRGDLLEDEGTEKDEEAETESKRTETWQVWPSWGQRWISGNMENGAHLGGHSEEAELAHAQSVSQTFRLYSYMCHVCAVSPRFLPALIISLLDNQVPLFLVPQTGFHRATTLSF